MCVSSAVSAGEGSQASGGWERRGGGASGEHQTEDSPRAWGASGSAGGSADQSERAGERAQVCHASIKHTFDYLDENVPFIILFVRLTKLFKFCWKYYWWFVLMFFPLGGALAASDINLLTPDDALSTNILFFH